MKKRIFKKIARSFVALGLVLTGAFYIFAMFNGKNYLLPIAMIVSTFALLLLSCLIISVLYLLNFNIKVVRIITSSISRACFLAIIVIFHHDFYAWTCMTFSLGLLILDIFLKPLKQQS